MKTIRVKKKQVDHREFIRRSATIDDYSELIHEPCIIKDENDLIVGVYGVLTGDRLEQLRSAITKIKITKNKRTQGLITQSRIFGYMPREPIRKNWCSSVMLSRENPKNHAIVCQFATVLADYYKTYAPEIYSKHLSIVKDKVLPQWKIKDSPFTSGIINKNNPLKYHFDSGNFRSVYSNMVGFKKDIEGGHLAMPEYDIGLAIADGSITFFDGQSILHGVTPIQYLTEDAYRFTVVYYSLKGMWKCLPIDKEIARIRNIKAEQMNTRYLRQSGNLPDDPWADKIEMITKEDEELAEETMRSKIR